MTAEEMAALCRAATLKERQVELTQLPNGVRVSTVFLNITPDPSNPEPYQWETMIRGGTYDSEGEQYASLEDARAGHELWVLVAKGELIPEAIREMRTVTAS
jgi:hypothetical protein